jgi:hypothetical protein
MRKKKTPGNEPGVEAIAKRRWRRMRYISTINRDAIEGLAGS